VASSRNDTPLEGFIIGRGVYHNWRTACVHNDDVQFRIDPAPLPLTALVLINVAIATFFGVVFWIVSRAQPVASGSVRESWLWALPLLGCATCAAGTIGVMREYLGEQRRGAWLIYDRTTGRVQLPREQKAFDRSEVVVQYITSPNPNNGDPDQCSEINLVECRDAGRRRWPLLRSIFNVRAFEWLVEPLLAHTDLEVVRVTRHCRSGAVTETRYRRGDQANQALDQTADRIQRNG
jgi:hypothetical protein